MGPQMYERERERERERGRESDGTTERDEERHVGSRQEVMTGTEQGQEQR